MTKTELLAEIENFKQKDSLPYLNNKEYKRLFKKGNLAKNSIVK